MVPLLTSLVWLSCGEIPTLRNQIPAPNQSALKSPPSVSYIFPAKSPAIGILFQPSFLKENVLLEPARPYHPQAGDVFLCTDHLLIARLGHFIAGADSPHHSGLIFLKPNGQAAMLEGGPHNTLRVRVLDMEANLKAYEGLGDTIWIRRRAKPLTPEQSKKLTDFSLAQDGKQFAWGRLLGQLTPFRSRGPWRTQYIGGPHGERTSYFCSELVTESLVACGALTAERTRPAATYPCDLFLGQSPIPFINDNLDINKTWDPPARWFSKLPLKAAN